MKVPIATADGAGHGPDKDSCHRSEETGVGLVSIFQNFHEQPFEFQRNLLCESVKEIVVNGSGGIIRSTGVTSPVLAGWPPHRGDFFPPGMQRIAELPLSGPGQWSYPSDQEEVLTTERTPERRKEPRNQVFKNVLRANAPEQNRLAIGTSSGKQGRYHFFTNTAVENTGAVDRLLDKAFAARLYAAFLFSNAARRVTTRASAR